MVAILKNIIIEGQEKVVEECDGIDAWVVQVWTSCNFLCCLWSLYVYCSISLYLINLVVIACLSNNLLLFQI